MMDSTTGYNDKQTMDNTTYYIDKDRTPADETTPVTYYFICGLPTTSIEYINIYFVLMCYVKPTVSVLGITANIISLQILKRSGLHKPSNILLFSLAIADTLCLGRAINYGSILFWFGPDVVMCGFQYSQGMNYFLFCSLVIMQYFHLWGECCNTMFPVLITFERLVAVFKPMAFATIVTRKRTIIAVGCAFLIWLPWSLFVPSLYDLRIEHLSKNTTYIRPYLSNFLFENLAFINMFDSYVNQTFSDTIPLILVVTGNIILGVTVSVALKKRKSLTSSQKTSWSPRTTRTLMLSCLFFVFITVTTTIMTEIDNEEATTGMGDYVWFYVRREIRVLIQQIYSSSSLLIYITSNSRFYHIFCAMFGITKNLNKVS